MTLLEAIHTRQPFRRPSWRGNGDNYIEMINDQFRFQTSRNGWAPRLGDLSATDYELKIPEKLIRKDAFESVMTKLLSEEDYTIEMALDEMGFNETRTISDDCPF